MAGFENYTEEVREIEREIERKGIVLGIDWANEAQVRALAREAIEHSGEEVRLAASSHADYQLIWPRSVFMA